MFYILGGLCQDKIYAKKENFYRHKLTGKS